MNQNKTPIEERHLLILQELMNIAVGSASADLEGVLHLNVELHVPKVETCRVAELPDYMQSTINMYNKSSLVGQKFWGSFSGMGLLVFPHGGGEKILSILNENGVDHREENLTELVQGALLEVGNILVGACIGKLSQLLETVVTYSPPEINLSTDSEYRFLKEEFSPEDCVIIMRTFFKFLQNDFEGYLMLITNHRSMDWLKHALEAYVESFS